MPGMRIFGRRCSLATDDFLFIGIVDSIFFLPWLGWIPVIYAHYLRQRASCGPDSSLTPLLDVSLPGLSLLFLANWMLGGLFVVFSVRGSITQPEKRRHVVPLVYVKLAVSVLDVAWAVLGSVLMSRGGYCHIYGVGVTVKVVTICQWVMTVVRLLMIVLFYDVFGSSSGKIVVQKEPFATVVRRSTIRRWNLRFQALFLWCTTPSSARREAIKTASELMAFLSSDLDLVSSDVIAGLLLYRRKCLKEYKLEKEALDSAPPIMLEDGSAADRFPPEGLPEWMNLQSARRYFHLGLGVFGWPWYVYRHLACGCCHLLGRLTCCFPLRRASRTVLGDNCCGCNLAGLRATSGLPFQDLVHVSFADRVFEVPFFVAIDRETDSVLVTVRGTMSFDDVLTDVAAAFAPLDDPGCPPGALCHGGMLRAAREIRRKLHDRGVLEEAMKNNPGYHLVVTGHSLGASVASILTLLLRGSGYPEVRGFAFAPAPTLSGAALAESRRCVFTLVYGNDSVVYLNYENVHAMINEMVRCLKECPLPKYKVFLSDKDPLYSEEDGTGVGVEDEKPSNPKKKSPERELDVEGRRSSSSSPPSASEGLYVAGTILHIRVADAGYRLKLCSADALKPLVFRPNMVFDHFPQFMQKCLQRLGHSPTVKVATLKGTPENGVTHESAVQP